MTVLGQISLLQCPRIFLPFAVVSVQEATYLSPDESIVSLAVFDTSSAVVRAAHPNTSFEGEGRIAVPSWLCTIALET